MKKNLISKKEHDIIKQELNIEKWPLFAPSTCRKKSRVFKRIITLENGDIITRTVTIGKVNEDEVNILRIGDYKVFCAVVKLWEEADRPIENEINFTLYSIARVLKLTWSGKTVKEICESLTRLRDIPIVWKNSYYQKETNTMETTTKHFNILERLEIFERKLYYKTENIYFAFSKFKINFKIISNLLNNYSKPVYLDVILKFKKEISILLYGYIDLVMADKECFERKTKELFIDLGLAEYSRPSKRKQLLEPALKELEGAELTTGILSYLKLEKTVDGTDYKVVFRKSKKKLKVEDKTTKGQILIQNIIEQKKLPDNRKVEIKDNPLLSKLVDLGVTEKVAKNLLKENKAEFIEDWINIVTIERKDVVEDKAAYLVKAIKDNWSLSAKVKKKRIKIEEEKDKKLREEELKLKKEYNNYLIPKVDECLKNIDKKIIKKELKDYQELYLKKHPEEFRESMLKVKSVRDDIEKNYKIIKAKKFNLITLEEWKSQR